MNELINLLAEQATTHIEPVPGKSGEGWIFDKEKFAELLINECIKVAIFKNNGMVYTADVAGHVAAGRSIAAKMIKDHFGIK